MAPEPSEKPKPIDTSVRDDDKPDSNPVEEQVSPHQAPADSAKFDSPNDCNHPPDLSGWGIAGERYGGMGQARLRDSETDEQAARQEMDQRRGGGSRSTTSDSDGSSDTDGYSVASRNPGDNLSKDERHELENNERERELFEQGGSRSYHGGMNQGFMRYVHLTLRQTARIDVVSFLKP
jgi:hypothetical protein